MILRNINTKGLIQAVLLILAVVLLTISCINNSDTEKLRERFKNELLGSNVNTGRVRELITTLNEDGSWPGIDYADTTRTGFQHTEHLDNMVSMARAYKKPGSDLNGDRELKKAFDKAMGFWLKNDFTCENWWNNQIGTPTAMVSILLMMDEDLSDDQVKKMVRITERANLNASGARPSGDRIKIAGIYAKCALFKRDNKAAEEVMKVIEGEIKFAPEEKQKYDAEGKPAGEFIRFPGTGRGIQADFSFHHRTDRVNNTLSYGTGYADAFAEWAAMVADTRYRFSDSSLHLLTDYYLEGICKQMVYNRIPDPGILNRDISRRGAGRQMGSSTPVLLLKASDYRRDELENVVHARKGEPSDTGSFAKFFWQTEHFVFQRPGFYTSVRMYSTRNCNMEEPYNGEGLKNHYRADGTNYLSLTGIEYSDIAPVFDWRKIPGATIMENESMPPENDIQKKGLTAFAGAVTDGTYGAAAFDFISPHDGTKARKSWFFFDKQYICLGAGITSENREHPVATTLNQYWLNGPVTINDKSGTRELGQGDRTYEKVNWVYHNNTGYIFPGGSAVNIYNKTASGTWFSINRQANSPKDTVSGEVFKIWLDHGISPKADYLYIVMPGADIHGIEAYLKDPEITILSNTADVQAVYNKVLRIAYAVFYKPGRVELAGNLIFAADSPCMLMVVLGNDGITTVTASDPSRELQKVSFTVNRDLQIKDPGSSALKGEKPGTSILTIDLPTGQNAGKSVTADII